MGNTKTSRALTQFRACFDKKSIEDLAVTSGFTRRFRKVRPFELVLAGIATLSRGGKSTLADIRREYIQLTGENVEYKPFHNRLVKDEFEILLRGIAERAISSLTPKVNRASRRALAKFEDVLVQDGSSFRVHDALTDIFPRRFGHFGGCAGVEVHATMSLLSDQITRLAISADTAPERPYLPEPEDMKKCLILGDRGYADLKYARRVKDAGGDVLIRTQRCNPVVKRLWVEGERVALQQGRNAAQVMHEHSNATLDMDAEWRMPSVSLRLVSFCLPNGSGYVHLLTTLGRRLMPANTLAQLYRLRWQVELLFREFKSHAGLTRWNTRSASLTRALIWLSVITVTVKRFVAHQSGSVERIASTLTASRVLESRLPLLLTSLSQGRSLRSEFESLLKFLRENASRAHPERDRRSGRYAQFLEVVG